MGQHIDKCINWHGLPGINFDDEKSAIFTNIGHDLKICKLDSGKLFDAKTFSNFADSGGFDCLNTTIPTAR